MSVNILAIIDLNLARIILKKQFVLAGVDYHFIDPVPGEVTEKTASLSPAAVILQDSYQGEDYDRVIGAVREGFARNRSKGKILILSSGAGNPRAWEGDDSLIRIGADDPSSLKVAIRNIVENAVKIEPRAGEKKRRVLFVDDAKMMHTFVEKNLDPGLYDIIHACDGKEGLAAYEGYLPDLIITDIEMPVMDGLAFCRAVKESNKDRFIPIIIMSSLGAPLDKDTAFNCGADDYFVKPVDPDLLTSKLDEYFETIERKKRSRVLVVDDSKVAREYVRHALIKQGINVIAASNGEEALRVLDTVVPEIVLTDIEMPVMDGYELCEEIRRRPDLADISILMMSSRSRPTDIKKGEALGVLHYFVKPFDIEKLLLAVERIMMERFHILKKEGEYLLTTIKSLIKALEARDEYTQGHSERVARYSRILGTRLGLTDAELDDLDIAASLHDIGKIGVRDRVLLKEGALTDDEYAHIQEHAVVGAEIMRPVESLKRIIPLILHHHERWDGKGYPKLISGEEIPLGARIIAVADTYDAMTSNRPYREAMSHEKAVSIIRENIGTQFCPGVAEAFMAAAEEGPLFS